MSSLSDLGYNILGLVQGIFDSFTTFFESLFRGYGYIKPGDIIPL